MRTSWGENRASKIAADDFAAVHGAKRLPNVQLNIIRDEVDGAVA
jgi:hypothetical protein